MKCFHVMESRTFKAAFCFICFQDMQTEHTKTEREMFVRIFCIMLNMKVKG